MLAVISSPVSGCFPSFRGNDRYTKASSTVSSSRFLVLGTLALRALIFFFLSSSPSCTYGPKRPVLRYIGRPDVGWVPIGTSALISSPFIVRAPVHSGKREHERKRPPRPSLTIMLEPQTGHLNSAG